MTYDSRPDTLAHAQRVRDLMIPLIERVGVMSDSLDELKGDPVAHIPPLGDESIRLALDDVRIEVLRQDRLARSGKFGGTHVMPGGTDLERLAVLAEEFGEASIEVCKGIEVDGQLRRPGLREELVQVAAVASAWAAAIDEGRTP